MMYARGWGVPVDDAQAQAWIRRAECRCGITGEGEYDLALEMSDEDRIRSPAEREGATKWLIRAAEAGNRDAQSLLGSPTRLKQRGLSVEANLSEYWRGRASAD